jgi:hypothetical protein
MSGENTQVHAAAAVTYAGGAVPSYVWQSGAFTGTITDTGTGNMQLLLNANDGVDSTECAILLSARNQLNAPRQVDFQATHTSDTSKQILCTEEGAAGAVSVAADVDFDIIIIKEARP